ncbi:MAG: L7Ae/L30e/S12e/Gadd45 family ribosomal protein [Moorellaceae bacterium]
MDRVLELLGLALRAGKLAWGSRAAKAGLRRKKVYLILIAEDASSRLKTEFRLLCFKLGVPLVVWGTKEMIGLALGKPPCSVAGVQDEGLAELIRLAAGEVGRP